MKSRMAPKKKGPRGGAQWRCVKCKKYVGAKQIEKDHIEPIIPLDRKATDMTWDELIERLYCAEENIQLLCKDCHKKKTSAERVKRGRTNTRGTPVDA